MNYINVYNVFCFCVAIWTKDVSSLDVIKGSLPDPSSISTLFNAFIGPIMRALPENKARKPPVDETVNKVIEQKVVELRSFLQDNDIGIDGSILFGAKDDTNIIEFLPKTQEISNKPDREDKLKTNLRKYKKVKEKINKALIKESVSNKTKSLVMKTIDDLLRKLVGSQCNWKKNFRTDERNIIADKWNEGFEKVKTVINNLLGNNTVNSRKDNNAPEYLNNLQILFRSIAGDAELISKKYKIQCEFVPKQIKPVPENALRNNWDKTDIEDERCHNVYICSDELTEYLNLFYSSLKETSVTVVKNYAEMYARDVGIDDEEKQNVMVILHKVTNETENNVLNIFIEETKLLKFNKAKNKHANIDALTRYIKNVIKSVKENITNGIRSELEAVKEKIAKDVEVDLNVNVDVDLGNLEREFISKICAIFRLCNGKYGGRRLISDIDKNDLNVQLKLSLVNGVTDISKFKPLFNAKNVTIHRMNVTRTTHYI